jgi:hypothetical protein
LVALGLSTSFEEDQASVEMGQADKADPRIVPRDNSASRAQIQDRSIQTQFDSIVFN